MASIRLIKRRIKSTKNIGQITKAMQMVAASKMKKAQDQAIATKPYSEKILEIVKSLSLKTDPKLHPLLKQQEEIKTYLCILITTNKGLCGSLNTNLVRSLNNFIQKNINKGINFDFLTLGQKGQSFVLKTGGHYLADFSDLIPFTKAVIPIVKTISDGYLKEKYSRVYLFYNNFINALKQEPVNKRILPLILPNAEEEIQLGKRKDVLYEPTAKEILDFLLPFYIETQVRGAILEGNASEHSARMMAMKNATENAQALMDGLTLEYNKARQQSITLEIADITTAKISLEK
ncbi:ATP synthase F1 subunit gamma [Candidatus Beckwithbacteria bacterium CG10_big_fil_rev_8_21_14_0_10_34_10]|uniref:ATP synthase gamma chain n=1 Tax=Candidatus Beckwithbacteria bacterium CG10_big_fil_rev_8_21_14_0_10_34_10 TaxID=1974495 RepID=A0A2H0W8W0_9BACT|nr:MAG: ATP synthase F1 subunit gamma [Candidatus Beckwithbacteria bacterium CG10_big_fil_rev_8_21_14_0_10_34_10]